VVYDCMDELSCFAGAPTKLRELERELFARADVVFTGGQSLYEAKKSQHRNVHAFPSSVDAAHFGAARGPLADPEDQAALPHPRLGFFGVVDERMDLELVAALADARPSYQIVILGPVVKIDPESLPRRPNLHWLGKKDYRELPAYLAGWDAAIMPFARNEATRFISPTKTLEYLAAGKTVVSTAITDVVKPYGDRGLVEIADRAGFPAAVDRALGEQRLGWRAAADAFVASTSWDSTWAKMNEIVDRCLAGARVAPEKEVPCSIG
jgi:glycosyltransferase involved in cell wall biosynthesis